jgi:hypothetical protein
MLLNVESKYNDVSKSNMFKIEPKDWIMLKITRSFLPKSLKTRYEVQFCGIY